MPDITMCKGEGCPIKNKCYRYTAIPTPQWQSYFIESPVKIQDKIAFCEEFWSDIDNSHILHLQLL